MRGPTLLDGSPTGTPGPDGERGDETVRALAEAGVPPALLPLLRETAEASPFLASCAVRQRGWLASIADADPTRTIDALAAETDALEGDEADVMEGLREGRERAALLVALADRGGLWSLRETTAALSRIADAGCRTAWRHAVADATRRRRLPYDAVPERGGFLLALGKLGSSSLNYSSDIDLICFYDRDRAPEGDAGTGFAEAAKAFTRLLSARHDGRIAHRVDWRLRPDPGATPLAISTAAAANYYQSQARSWERLAFIKARPVAGDREAARDFLAEIEPFVWRRTFDFQVADEIAQLAARIRERGGTHDPAADPAGWNLKTGLGGIREIEFLVQSQQTILGGRRPLLRAPATPDALEALRARGTLDADTAEALAAAYAHHRTLEHRLQMIDDAQTQTLPPPGQQRARLAALMGVDEPTLLGMLAHHRRVVAAAFERTLPGPDAARPARGGPATDEAEVTIRRVHGVLGRLELPEGEVPGDGDGPAEGPDPATGALAGLGFAEPDRAARTLRGWLAARYPSFRSSDARRLAERRMPEVVAALAGTPDPDSALAALDRALARMPAGLSWHAMLDARPGLIGLLGRLAGHAPTLMETAARDPALLAEAAAADFWDPPDERAIRTRLEGIERRSGGLEAAMDAVRLVNRGEMFRIAVRMLEAGGSPDPYAFGDDVTRVTEACLTHLWQASLNERDMPSDAPLALVAMGRLGARETTLSSDLDLMIVSRSAETATRDARLVRTLIAAIGSPTAQGRFREVDMRLRPSGRSGPLVTPLPSFVSHHERAEPWELIALGRARVVCGALGEDTAEAIATARSTTRDVEEMRQGAAAVLARTRTERPPSGPGDLKNRAGGLFEIEFAAQLARYVEGGVDPAETRTPAILTTLERRLAGAATLRRSHRALLAEAQKQAATGRTGDASEAPDPSIEAALAEAEAALDAVVDGAGR